MNFVRPALCLLLAIAAAPSARAAESYDGCKYVITSLPAFLDAQGVYCLQKDLATNIASGAAIFVASNNITIDCNDFKIGNLAAGPGTMATGIMSISALNTTVRGCNVRGFLNGIDIVGSGQIVERNRMEGNIRYAISVEGAPSVIRNNLVYDTGPGSNLRTSGIRALAGVDVIGNTIEIVEWTGDGGVASGIDALANGVAVIRDNIVRNVVANGVGAIARGIGTSGGEADIHGNYISTPMAVGVRCVDGTGIIHDNRTAATPANFSNCADSGGNISR